MTDEKFDILDHIAGRTYPESTVVTYFDEANIRAAVDLEATINRTPDSETATALEQDLKKIHETLDKTALTWELRGFPEDVKRAIAVKAEKISDKEERAKYQDVAALEASITSVKNFEGKSADFDFDKLAAIVLALPAGEWEKLISQVVRLSYESILFERGTVNADF